MATAEAQKRWRDKRRRLADPVYVYLNAVIEWDTTERTPGSSTLALRASDMLDTITEEVESPDPFAIMFGITSTRRVYRSHRMAQEHLARAQEDLNAGAATIASVRAGLAACKRLLSAPTPGDRAVLQEKIVRAMLGGDGGLAPAHLCEPITGTSEDR